MRADEVKVQQVIYNLIDNAIKYTPDGGEIRLEADRSGDTLNIRVRDNGIGIPEKDRPHLFERFYKGQQGEFVTVGLDYLYAMPVCKGKLHLEFNLGLGYIYSYVKPYDVFEAGGKAFKEGYIKNFHWVGPVKAGASLVVPIRTTAKKR